MTRAIGMSALVWSMRDQSGQQAERRVGLDRMFTPDSNALTISNENAVNGLVGIPCEPDFATELEREITEWLKI